MTREFVTSGHLRSWIGENHRITRRLLGDLERLSGDDQEGVTSRFVGLTPQQVARSDMPAADRLTVLCFVMAALCPRGTMSRFARWCSEEAAEMAGPISGGTLSIYLSGEICRIAGGVLHTAGSVEKMESEPGKSLVAVVAIRGLGAAIATGMLARRCARPDYADAQVRRAVALVEES